jgi:hypothetical protein
MIDFILMVDKNHGEAMPEELQTYKEFLYTLRILNDPQWKEVE